MNGLTILLIVVVCGATGGAYALASYLGSMLPWLWAIGGGVLGLAIYVVGVAAAMAREGL